MAQKSLLLDINVVIVSTNREMIWRTYYLFLPSATLENKTCVRSYCSLHFRRPENVYCSALFVNIFFNNRDAPGMVP